MSIFGATVRFHARTLLLLSTIDAFTEAFSFKEGFSFRHPHKVHNIVPGDFTHSGQLDLLVMSQGQNNQLDMFLYPALPSGGFGTSFQPTYN